MFPPPMKTRNTLSLGFLFGLLLAGGPASVAAECPESLVLWEPSGAEVPRDGMLMIRLRGGARELGPLLHRSEVYLEHSRTHRRVPLEKVEDLIDPDGGWGRHLYRPVRPLRARSRYRLGSSRPEIRGLGTHVSVRSGFASRVPAEPLRFRKVHHTKEPAGTPEGTILFEARGIPEDAWVAVEIEEARDVVENGHLDIDFPAHWEPMGLDLVESVPGPRGVRRVALSGDPCQLGLPWRAGAFYRARFALVTADGAYMGPDSAWTFFRSPADFTRRPQ